MIGRTLKKLRTEHNITQKELADYLEITPKAVSFYELDQRMPSQEIIIKIANKFNVSIDFLFGYEKAPAPPTLSPFETGMEIQQLLAERNLTPTDVDARAGIKTGTTAKIIKGKYEPHFDVATKIAEALDIPIALLLGVREDKQTIQKQKFIKELYRHIPNFCPTDAEIQTIIDHIRFNKWYTTIPDFCPTDEEADEIVNYIRFVISKRMPKSTTE